MNKEKEEEDGHCVDGDGQPITEWRGKWRKDISDDWSRLDQAHNSQLVMIEAD